MLAHLEPKVCAVFVNDELTPLQSQILIAQLRLLIKFKYQIQLSTALPSLPESIKSSIRTVTPPKKKSSLLSKIFKPLTGNENDSVEQLKDVEFSLCYDLKNQHNWSERNLLFLHSPPQSNDENTSMLKKAKKIIVTSQLLKKILLERFQLDPISIEILYPFYNRDLFSSKDRIHSRLISRQKLNYSTKDFIVGYFMPEGSSSRELEYIQKLAQSMNSESQIKFVNLSDSQNLSAATYHAIDLFVCPALEYGVGITVLDAMACGTPVLTTPFIGTAELILSKQFVKDLPEPKDWIGFISDFESQRDWLVAVGRQNSERALLFDENHHLKRFIQILTDENLIRID